MMLFSIEIESIDEILLAAPFLKHILEFAYFKSNYYLPPDLVALGETIEVVIGF